MARFNDRTRAALIPGVLVVVTMAAFWRVLHSDFVFLDDFLYVGGNPQVLAGLTWPGVLWAFHSMVAANWHPATMISFMLDCQLFGPKPGAIHLVNLLLHTANACLIFVWLRRWTGAFWKSALVAALFAWHPVHVESVAWVSERKDVLSAFFWLLALLAYGSYRRIVQSPRSKVQSRILPDAAFFRVGTFVEADGGDVAVCFVAAGFLVFGADCF